MPVPRSATVGSAAPRPPAMHRGAAGRADDRLLRRAAGPELGRAIGQWAMLAVALLQLLLPPLASIADALLTREAGAVEWSAHVEAEGSPLCPQHHTPDCELCRVVGALTLASHAAPVPAAIAARAGVVVATADQGAAADLRRADRARAPPLG